MPPFQTTRATGISPATSRRQGGNRVVNRAFAFGKKDGRTGLLNRAGRPVFSPCAIRTLWRTVPTTIVLNGGAPPPLQRGYKAHNPHSGNPLACKGLTGTCRSTAGQPFTSSSVQSSKGCSFFRPQSGANSNISRPARFSLCPLRRPVIHRDRPAQTFCKGNTFRMVQQRFRALTSW